MIKMLRIEHCRKCYHCWEDDEDGTTIGRCEELGCKVPIDWGIHKDCPLDDAPEEEEGK